MTRAELETMVAEENKGETNMNDKSGIRNNGC